MRNKISKSIRRVLQSAVVGILALSVPGFGQDANTLEVIQKLQKRIDELEQKVKALEQTKQHEEKDTIEQVGQLSQKVGELEASRELDKKAAEDGQRTEPRITAGPNGFGLSSSNGDFAFSFNGVLQVDSRTFFNDSGTAGNDGILLRRARPIFRGTVFRDFDFLFVPDFGGNNGPQIFDAYLNYRYRPALQLEAGKFKSPIGLEQLQADRDLLFNERALATSLVPNRDLGFMLHGDFDEGVVSYAAGIFNGVGDARNSSNFDFEDNKAFEGRLFFQPFKTTTLPALRGLGFGVSGSFESMQGTNTTGLPSTTGGTLAGYATDGQQQFFAYNPTNKAVVMADGDHWRLSPQAWYYYGPLGLIGEYVKSDQRVTRTVTAPFTSARLDNTAWEVTGSWVLTGEPASFTGVNPKHPFDPKSGGWGSWQLVGRYAELDVDKAAFPLFSDPNTSASSAASWSIGLNWWLNRNIRFMTSYSRTRFQGGGGAGPVAPATVTRKDEQVLFTRLQLAF